MTKTQAIEALARANAIINKLVNGMEAIQRTDNIDYAHGVAEEAMNQADAARTRNSNGYLAVQESR